MRLPSSAPPISAEERSEADSRYSSCRNLCRAPTSRRRKQCAGHPVGCSTGACGWVDEAHCQLAMLNCATERCLGVAAYNVDLGLHVVQQNACILQACQIHHVVLTTASCRRLADFEGSSKDAIAS